MNEKYPAKMSLSGTEVDRGIEIFAEITRLCEQENWRVASDRLEYLAASVGKPEWEWRIEIFRCLIAKGKGDIKQSAVHLLNAIKAGRNIIPFDRQRSMYSDFLFVQHFDEEKSDEQRLREAFAYGDFERGLRPYVHDRSRHGRHERLRLGFIASSFGSGVVSNFSIQILCGLDKHRYQVFCYACRRKEDATSDFIRERVQGWWQPPAGEDYASERLAQQIYEDEIDILFDLEGHSAGGEGLQAAALRPAPVQLSGIGYMSTTGMGSMDYFLGDPYCDPPGSERDFSERLLRLPHSHFCYTPTELAFQEKRERLPHEGVVFGSFNQFDKINGRVLACWNEILRRVPESRLLLKNKLASAQEQRTIKRRLREAGLPMERVLLENSSKQYMGRYNAVDIALDTFPYVGGGTTCDALYMGVPVVSLYGRRHGTRFGYSLLMNTGLGELAAATEEEYVEKAVALAGDAGLLSALHREIPDMFRKSPVMDAAAYLRDMQAAFEQIWQEWLSGKA